MIEVAEVATDKLIPYVNNARSHSDDHVAQIAASIKEFGWTNPVLIDGENGIIAGHGRVLAARKLGMGEVPCIELAGLTETQKRAYILADNKLALNAGWDNDLLALELGALDAEGFDLSLTGFGEDELRLRLGDAEGLTDPDDAPGVPDNPVTVEGDVWLLGKHRLVCGDSTDADTVAACLNGVEPHLMVTDPPYGVDYDPKWRNRVRRSNGRRVGGMATGEVMNDTQDDWSEAWGLFPGDVAYVWHGSLHTAAVQGSLERAGFSMRALIVWAKNKAPISRGHYHHQHETCWYAVRKKGHWNGGRKQTTLWQIDKPRASETGHSTQKPVECMKRPIENNSSAGQAVYEPFCGSGTTIIAAEMTGRACHAIELSPAYVDVAVKRWQDFTGERATSEATGGEFPVDKKA